MVVLSVLLAAVCSACFAAHLLYDDTREFYEESDVINSVNLGNNLLSDAEAVSCKRT